jgi:hypothetical protein
MLGALTSKILVAQQDDSSPLPVAVGAVGQSGVQSQLWVQVNGWHIFLLLISVIGRKENRPEIFRKTKKPPLFRRII